jgi:hypothetical protein
VNLRCLPAVSVFVALAVVGVMSCVTSCATATLFTLPEARTKEEQMRNDWAPAAIPVALAVDVATAPLLMVGAVARSCAGVDEGEDDSAVAGDAKEAGSVGF